LNLLWWWRLALNLLWWWRLSLNLLRWGWLVYRLGLGFEVISAVLTPVLLLCSHLLLSSLLQLGQGKLGRLCLLRLVVIDDC